MNFKEKMKYKERYVKEYNALVKIIKFLKDKDKKGVIAFGNPPSANQFAIPHALAPKMLKFFENELKEFESISFEEWVSTKGSTSFLSGGYYYEQ